MIQQMIIKSNRKIAADTYEMVLISSQPMTNAFPGQFLHLKLHRHDLILRRPISIAAINDDGYTLIYKVVGTGTQDMTTYPINTTLDVLGPVGHGFKTDLLHAHDQALVIGGGVGISPLYALGQRLVTQGVKVTFVLGYQTKNQLYYDAEFKALGSVIYTSQDGSLGLKGTVADGVNTLTNHFQAIYACGPLRMNEFVKEHFQNHPHVYLSLEERMACGMGACYACDTKDKKHRVCVEGPVFNAKEVEL